MGRITIAHVGHDGDEYVHTFMDAEWMNDFRPGFVTVVGVPTNGNASRGRAVRHYPTDRVLRVIETGEVVFSKFAAAKAVQS